MKSSSILLLLPLLVSAATRVDLAAPPAGVFDLSGMGTAAPVWNSPARYDVWAEGFRRGGFRMFRFPNGTLSNEYHWNGAGTFDSAGIWHPDPSQVKPGLIARSRWRGTTKDNYDAHLPSLLDDGDTATMWWGETFQDSILPWAYLDLGTERAFDSIEILWGAIRPSSVRVQGWIGPAWPQPHQAEHALWKTLAQDDKVGARTALRLKGGTGRFVALRPVAAPKGVQVREVRLFAGGKQITSNTPDSRTQTKAIAISAHPGSVIRTDWNPEWTFDRFAQWLKGIPGGEALICVNFGTGTPEEAAAWVRYANVVKKYGIRRWHVGNEVDGTWEDGGPVDPAQYAVRFAEFARAMKAVDPTIEVYGPGTFSVEFIAPPGGKVRRSGRADDLTWLESFLARIGAIERSDKKRLLDGVDIHSYPYWFESGEPSEEKMLYMAQGMGIAFDTLKSMMARRLEDPDSRKISLSEFNSTVKITSLTLEQVNGVVVAMMLQDLWSRFPERAASVLWEPSGGEPMNPDGSAGETYGSLRIFTPARGGLRSELEEPPTSAFWGQYMARSWMGEGWRTVPQTWESSVRRASVSVKDKAWSVLFTNPGTGPETLVVQSARSMRAKAPKGGNVAELLTWGPDHYKWSDKTSQARAIPNLGPTARALSETDSVIVVPARSLCIVRLGASDREPMKLLHASWSPSRMLPVDTLVVSASVRAEGRRIDGASWSVAGSKPVEVGSFDGAWDGSHEGVVLRIPASALPRGRDLSLKVVFRSGKDTVSAPVVFSHEDFPRAVKELDHFGTPGLRAASGETWWTYGHGGNGTNMKIAHAEDPNGGHFEGVFRIIQPPSQNFPNFALAGLNVNPTAWSGDWKNFRGLVFDLRTRHSATPSKFLLQALTTVVTDYDDFQMELPNTNGSWRRVWIRWDEFDQSGWGKDKGAFDPSALRALQFRADGAGEGSIDIDNLSFFGTEGAAIELKDPPRPTRGR
jgi:hypothetical protein